MTMRVHDILRSNQLAPLKELGQNFLTNPHIAQQIVDLAGVTDTATVIELGVGLGSLTKPLAAAVNRVIGIEIDAGLIAWHQQHQTLADNVTLRHQDLLKTDYAGLATETGGPLRIIANLPYSVTSPLLFTLLENRRHIDWAVLMVQKEVADRLVAGPRSKQYGILAVLLGSCCRITTLLQVGPGNFHPRPRVDSTVIKLDFAAGDLPGRCLTANEFELFRLVVRTAFQQRRKTLKNSLAGLFTTTCSPADFENNLRHAGIAPGTRPEALTIADFITIARFFA